MGNPHGIGSFWNSELKMCSHLNSKCASSWVGQGGGGLGGGGGRVRGVGRGRDQVSKQHLSTEELSGGCEVAVSAARASGPPSRGGSALKGMGGIPALGCNPRQKSFGEARRIQLNNMVGQASNRSNLAASFVADLGASRHLVGPGSTWLQSKDPIAFAWTHILPTSK